MIATIARRMIEKASVRGLALMLAIGSDEVPLVDLRDKLPTTCAYPERDMTKVDGVIIHHSATRGQSINSIAQFHIQTRGWCGIAYHYAIGWDGKIYILNSPWTKTNHAQNNNTRNIGVCLIGNYDTQPVPPVVINSCFKLIDYLEPHYGPLKIAFHRDTKATVCPGRYAIQALDSLRTLHQAI